MLGTVDVVTKEATVSFKERTDVTAVPAMGVVAETMTALVLASEALRKFGGDSVAEVVRNRDGYLASLARHAVVGRCGRPWLSTSLLVGMMGAGKSTVARLVAARLGRPLGRHRREVERSAGSPVREIFAAHGEARVPGRGVAACWPPSSPAPSPPWCRWAAVRSSTPASRARAARAAAPWCGCGPDPRPSSGGWGETPTVPCWPRTRRDPPRRSPASRPSVGRSTRRSPPS